MIRSQTCYLLRDELETVRQGEREDSVVGCGNVSPAPAPFSCQPCSAPAVSSDASSDTLDTHQYVPARTHKDWNITLYLLHQQQPGSGGQHNIALCQLLSCGLLPFVKDR